MKPMFPPPPPPPGGTKKPNPIAGFLSLIVLIFVGVAIGRGCSSTSNSSQGDKGSSGASRISASKTAVQVSANDLFSAYDANEVAADEIYKGQLLLVSGKVGSINKDFLGKIYLTLPSSSNPFMGVHAELGESEVGKASSLRKGQKIVLLCTGAGKIVTEAVLNDCIVR